MSSYQIFALPWQNIKRPILRWVLKYTHRWIEKLLGLTTLHRIYQTITAFPSNTPFPRRVLDMMQIYIDCDEKRRQRIPSSGPLAIIANHPFGAIEGLALLETVRMVRPDVKVLANFILSRIPELREDMIFVDPFATENSASHNVNSLRQALHWIRDGHALIIFPAGEVASFEKKAFHVREAPWHSHTITLIRRASPETKILPVFIPGKASYLFHFLGKIHPRLRTIMLPREMIRLHAHKLPLLIGNPIIAGDLHKRFSSDIEALHWLRFRTFLLAGRIEKFSTLNKHMLRLTLDNVSRVEEPIIDAHAKELLIDTIAQLPEDARLIQSETFNVYCVHGADYPILLHEIGRLREITFRTVGEGSGKSIDLDDFDEHYLHIFLWHTDRQEIAGAYRLGFTDKLVETKGVNALYTRTLFDFDETLLGHFPGPAIELGRSFVHPHYQRTFAPLLLLWRGVLAVVAKHPEYTILFGPVSISHNYRSAARDLLISHLKTTCFDKELARYISARLPPKISSIECLHPDYATFIATESDVYAAITEIEENQREMPILIRQYLKLGGKIIAFNVDPDFGTVVDGLIYVNLLKAPPRDIIRYMGKENYQAYIETPRDDE